jgi:hypothetical protein
MNIYHNPIWLENGKPSNQLPVNYENLSLLNKQLDEELNRINPKFLQVDNSSAVQPLNTMNNLNMSSMNQIANPNPINMHNTVQSFPNLANFENNTAFNQSPLNLVNTPPQENPACVRREGMLKIRDIDQRDKDVVVTFAILTKDRLSYFVNAKDETSIQGSIELAKIKESIKIINGFNSCFTIKTIDTISDCSICAESEDSAREWINAITQNSVNCNTMSTLNNLNKRGLLK